MPTGEHVEVYRDDTPPGEPRRFTKRFLLTPAGDYRPWTERERRVLQRAGTRARCGGREGDPLRRRGAGRPVGAADRRCRRHGRAVGDARSVAPRRRDAAQRGRGLRPLVGARAALPARARAASRAGLRAPRPQGRQHLHPVGAFGDAARGRRAARAALRCAGLHRRGVLAAAGCRAGRAAADRRRADVRVPIAAPARGARGRPARPPRRRPASSTGAATCSAWRRCCGAICPRSRTASRPAGRRSATPRRAPSCACCWMRTLRIARRSGRTAS